MRLNEKMWIFSGGMTPEWADISARRVDRALSDLRGIVRKFRREAPESARRTLFLRGMSYFLNHRSPLRDRLVSHPGFDYWLYLWEKHFSMPCEERDWGLQFGLFQGFAVLLAVLTHEAGQFDLVLDPDAHLHFYGSPVFLEFPKDMALNSVRITVRGSWIGVNAPRGISFRFPREFILNSRPEIRRFGPVSLRRGMEVVPGLTVECCGFLLTHGVVMHGLAQPGVKQRGDFAGVLKIALTHVEERDPALHAEMTDLVRVLIPLDNPVTYGSVSSSYVNLRGAICLSHSWDPLLQAETLIHEFCHQKMNQLLLADPILVPGQSGQAFYSPWRPDARRLRGLILGAHAFLNVSAYLMKSLERENYALRSKIAIMSNVARRLFEVEGALRSACAYGEFTEFGRRFVLGMSRELAGLFHAAQWFPPALIKEARGLTDRHRREHALPLTGIHKTPGFLGKVHPVPFGQKRIIRRRLIGARKEV